MATYETSNLVAILAAGRNPVWEEQELVGVADYDGAPSSSAHGVDLGDVVQALFFVQLRRQAHARTAFITLTYDAATTYTITINGTAHTPTPGANLAALVADLISDVNGGAQAAVVTASEESTGIVKIVGDVEADFYLSVLAAAGTGTVTATADASTATARIWLMGASPNAPGAAGNLALAADPDSGDPGAWGVPDASEYAVTYRNLTDRVTVAGYERMYVELDSVAGHASDGAEVVLTAHVFIGPCASETSS